MTTARGGQGTERAPDTRGGRAGPGADWRPASTAARQQPARTTPATGTATAPPPAGRAAGSRPDTDDLLGAYLRSQAADFLRSLRAHRGSVGGSEPAADPAEAVQRLRRPARRIGATLRTFRPLFDAQWAEHLRTELSWLSGTLAREYAYAARLDRLLAALHRLAGGPTAGPPAPSRGGASRREPPPAQAARAAALLERQLTLARTRAHTTALQALGSSRFHAVADEVAVLAWEVPELSPGTGTEHVLRPHAREAHRRLQDAVDALPLARSEHPFHAEALARSLSSEAQGDSAWRHVRLLLRLHRYAHELVPGGAGVAASAASSSGSAASAASETPAPLVAAARELDRHHEAAEAAAAAAAAARTPRIAPATAYALGVLHADQRHEVEAARFAFSRHWTAADAPQPPDRRSFP